MPKLVSQNIKWMTERKSIRSLSGNLAQVQGFPLYYAVLFFLGYFFFCKGLIGQYIIKS